jgi:hypothetical protein
VAKRARPNWPSRPKSNEPPWISESDSKRCTGPLLLPDGPGCHLWPNRPTRPGLQEKGSVASLRHTTRPRGGVAFPPAAASVPTRARARVRWDWVPPRGRSPVLGLHSWLEGQLTDTAARRAKPGFRSRGGAATQGETTRISANGNPTLCTSVIVPGRGYHVQSLSQVVQIHTTRE